MQTTLSIPCCNVGLCQDPANPFANLSAEGPDQNIFIGFSHGNPQNPPPTGWTWGTPGCVSFCTSTVSQADADLCAARQQFTCTTQNCEDASCGGNGGGGGWHPPGTPTLNPAVFSNMPQTCSVECPDGLPFSYTIPANQVFQLNQVYANQVANSLACDFADQQKMCLNDIPNSACLNQGYGAGITPSGGTSPFTFIPVGGEVPPGLSITQSGDTLLIEGIPTVPGTFDFAIQCVDALGLFMTKIYTITVLGVNSPSNATQGSPYNFTFLVSGGTAPFTFSIASGSLPSGLSMNSSGVISGTPSGSGGSSFGLQVTDSNGVTCTFNETMTVTATCNCKVTDWVANPGSCRLRLTAASYHDGILLPCNNATASALPGWDGTLPLFSGGQYLSVFNAPTTLSVSGHKFFGCNLNFNGTNWSLGIAGDSNGLSNGMWIGPNNSICPIGNYTFLLGCQVQPVLTLTLEAYTP